MIKMKFDKTVNELIIHNYNLRQAVSILIQGCRASKEGREKLGEWDAYRREEIEKTYSSENKN